MMFLLFVVWVGLLVGFFVGFVVVVFVGCFVGLVFSLVCVVFGLLIWWLDVCLGMHWWVGLVVGDWFGLLVVLVWFVEVVLFCFLCLGGVLCVAGFGFWVF